MRKFNNAVLLSLTAIFCLFSTAFAVAQTTLSSTSLNFGNMAVGSNSAIQWVKLTNNQPTALTITSLAASSGYALDPTTSCPSTGTVGAYGYCMLAVRFAPTALGAQLGSITISTNAGNSPQSVTLSGTGIAQTTLSAASLSFGNVAVGSNSAIQWVKLTNNQPTALTITSLGASSGYALDPTTSCPTSGTVGAYGYCMLAVTFKPVTPGAQLGSITISTNAGNSPQSVTLSGMGIAPTTLSAASLSFGNMAVGSNSAIQWVKLTNNQPTALTITSLGASSGYALDPTTSCPTSGTVGAYGYCMLAVTFKPVTPGLQSGTVAISTNAGNSPQSISLSGTGIAPTTLSATSLSFGNVAVNTTSAIQWVKLTNNQPTALTITSLVASSGYALDPTTTCPTSGTVGAYGYCMLAVRFAPTALGAQLGSITISTNAGNSPQSVMLSGTGIADSTLSSTSLNFGNMAVGSTSAIQWVKLTNNQPTALTITSLVAASGYALDPTTSCPTSGTVGANGYCMLAVTFKPVTLGLQPGGITISTNAGNSPQTVMLSGTGIPQATLSQTSLNFGNVAVNTNSAIQWVKLTNNQPTALTITSLVASSGYALDPTTTCPSSGTVGAYGYCMLAVKFEPVSQGAQPGSLAVNFAGASPQSVTLSGTGYGPPSLPVSGALPGGTTNVGYSAAINASGGYGTNFTFTVNGTAVQTNGTPLAIANGITASNTGGFTLSIGGTPTLTQTVSFTVSVRDSVGNTAGPNTYTISVNPPNPLNLPPPASASLPSGNTTQQYTGSINASGGSGHGYVFTVNGTQIPTNNTPATPVSADGLTFTNNGGSTLSIGGTPSAAGTFTLNVSVTDSANDSAGPVYYPVNVINPGTGSTATGNVSYSGSQTGWVYLSLVPTNNCNHTGCKNPHPGTAINATTAGALASGGAFVIHGVQPGTLQPESLDGHPGLWRRERSLTPRAAPPGDGGYRHRP
jgi:LEA14-like dessication related protein